MKTIPKISYVIVLAAIILMFGCGEKGGEKVAEKAMEKAIESSTGGNAKVDVGENSLRIQTEEGEMTITGGDSAKLPHDFPLEEYKNRYEELEHQMLEILNWRFRWFGKPEPKESK